MSCCGKKCGCPQKKIGLCGGKNSFSETELELLKILEEVLYLPIIKRKDDMPIFESKYDQKISQVALNLQQKGAIYIEFDAPLSNFEYESEFEQINQKGSIRLTNEYLNRVDFSLETRNLEV